MTLVGRAVSSERGETCAACDVFHVRVIHMSIDSHIYIYSRYMDKYTCIYQYVSSRAGGANVQLLHVCSLALGGLLHMHSLICSYVYNINIGIWCMSLSLTAACRTVIFQKVLYFLYFLYYSV